jgi:hypothetical protein
MTIREVLHMALIEVFGPDVDLQDWRKGRREELARIRRQQEELQEILLNHKLHKHKLSLEDLFEILMGLREAALGFEQRYPSKDGRLTAMVKEMDEKLEAMVQAALAKQRRSGLRLVENKP